MEEAIRVCIRQRPLFKKEVDAGHSKAWKLFEDGGLSLDITPPTGIAIKKSYAFDMCFDETCSNETVYEKTAKDIVRDTATGINGCYIAYGQTGCGKTYSIMGDSKDPGILPRSIAELFDIINEETEENKEIIETNYLLRVSYVEIYLERVNDLFQDGPKGESQPLENLDVKEDPKGGFFVVGLAEKEVTSIQDVMDLLQRAEMKRHFARTNFNETSSRSHTVFGTTLECTQTYADGTTIARQGDLKLVDLAGNERASASEGVESGKERQVEGQAINKSLFLLSEVIAKLSKKAEAIKKGGEGALEKAKKDIMHIPWRDSKLTRLLQKSLGGNSRAALLVALHPSSQALEISLSTLRFALKTKQIKKKIVQNFVSADQSLIMQQKELIKTLQGQLQALQEMTGVRLPPEAQGKPAAQQVGEAAGKKQPIVKAPPNIAIENLKAELQRKVDTLSKIILSSPMPRMKSMDERKQIEPLGRSITLAGIQNRFERLRTLPPTRQAQLYRELPAHIGEQEKSKIKTITGALEYLKRIEEMNKESSAIEEQQKREFGPSYDLQRYDTTKLEDLVAEGEAQSQEMRVTKKKLTALRRDVARLSSKNNIYRSQIDYLQGLLSKLGLSVLLTSTDVTYPVTTPILSSRLATPIPIDETFKKEKEKKLIDYVQRVQPMAFAMAHRLLFSALGRDLDAKHPPSEYDTIAKQRQQPFKDFQMEKKVDSIFMLLSPWEQYMLSLLFEQEDTRNKMKSMTDRFAKDIGVVQTKVRILLAEKMELIEHCSRLVDELRHYRFEVIPKSDFTETEKFSRLLTQLDSTSTQLAERTTELALLRDDYNTLEKDRDKLQIELEDVKTRLLTFDPTIIPDDLKQLEQNQELRHLLKEVLFSRHLVSESRIRIEESKVFEQDLRTVNQQLSKELTSIQIAYDSLLAAKKIVDINLKDERIVLQKRFQESYNAYEESERRCEELRSKLIQVETERGKLLKERQGGGREAENAAMLKKRSSSSLLGSTPATTAATRATVKPVYSSRTKGRMAPTSRRAGPARRSKLPTTIRRSQLPTTATTTRRSQLPTTATTTRRSQLPTTATTIRRSQLPTPATTARRSQLPTTATTIRRSQLPTTATTIRRSQLPTTTGLPAAKIRSGKENLSSLRRRI